MVAYRAPQPEPTPETQPYFDGLKQHKLMLQRCLQCQQPYSYRRPLCPLCQSPDVEWFQASGKGKLYSYVINHTPALDSDSLQVIAVVELDEGPRIMANLVGTEPDHELIKGDMPVEIAYDNTTEGTGLPTFHSAES